VGFVSETFTISLSFDETTYRASHLPPDFLYDEFVPAKPLRQTGPIRIKEFDLKFMVSPAGRPGRCLAARSVTIPALVGLDGGR